MFLAKIPRHIRQNAITEGDLECILTRNCEGTEQLRIIILTKNYFKVKQNGGTKIVTAEWKEGKHCAISDCKNSLRQL